MRTFALHPATLAATCLLALAGCGGVVLDHPLSDDETTEVDEALIGFWELEAASIDEADPKPGELWPHLAVGRTKGDDRAMEVATLDVEDGHVKVNRLEVLATRIGNDRYLSLRNPEKRDEGWFVVRYRIGEDDRMQLRVLDPEACAASVDAGHVQGEAKGPDRGHEVVSLTVEIRATTAEARAWIEKHGAGLFTEKAVVMRRLVKRAESSSIAAPDGEGPEPPEKPLPPAPEGADGPPPADPR